MSDLPATVTVTPVDSNTSLLDCTTCGPMGVWERHDVSKHVYDHMLTVHDVEENTINIKNIEEE